MIIELPRITTPEYTVNLPLSEKKVRFRPFLAKEEKVLLFAIERFSSDRDNPSILIDATMQIAQNCILTKDVDVKELPTVDLEYLFLNIRKQSIGEIVELMVEHNHEGCKFKNKVTVNLENTKLERKKEHTNKIEITNNSGIILKYPSIGSSVIANGNSPSNKTEAFYNLIISSIDKVYNGDDFQDVDQFSRKDLLNWVDQFPTEIIHKFYEFLDTMPYLSTKIKYKCGGCGVDEEMEVKGTADFFT